MKITLLTLSLTAAFAATASVATAQTTWIGADNAVLGTAGNWSNNLPSLTNTGTIPIGTANVAFNASVTDWVVIQNGGALANTSGGRQFNGGSWTMNGGSMTLTTNFQLVNVNNQTHTFTVNSGATLSSAGGITVVNTAAITGATANLNINGGSVSSTGALSSNGLAVFNGGTVNFTSGSLSTTGGSTLIGSGGNFSMSGGTRTGREVTNSGTMNISGGSFSTNSDRAITTTTGGITTISGGTVSIGAAIGSSLSGNGSYVFNGGTTNATGTISPTAGFTLTLGGTSVGSLTATNWGGTAANRSTNWLSGTGMSMTLSGAANWAETEWTNNRMFYNGQSSSVLGLTWAQVIDPLVGFNSGGGTYFNWNGGTNTLSLVTVPEPSTWAAIAIFLGAVVMIRRRRRSA